MSLNSYLPENINGYFCIYVDNELKPLVQVNYNDNGLRDVLLCSDLSLRKHTVLIQMWNSLQLEDDEHYISLLSFSVNEEGDISGWKQSGTATIYFIGDSWAGIENNIVRFMADKGFKCVSTGIGGFNSELMLEKYTWLSATKTIEPFIASENDVFIIEFGINDYYYHFTHKRYKEAISSLIDLLRKLHGENIKIYLLQMPRYLKGATGVSLENDIDILYDQYTYAIQELSSEKTVNSILTESIWEDLVWLRDKCHLDSESKELFADYILKNLE